MSRGLTVMTMTAGNDDESHAFGASSVSEACVVRILSGLLEEQLAECAESTLQNIGMKIVGQTLVVWQKQGEINTLSFESPDTLIQAMEKNSLPIRQYVKPLKRGEVRVFIFGDEGFFVMHVTPPEKPN